MANTKITSVVAHHCRQLKAETQDDIATALSVVEDEINDILGPTCAITERGDGRARVELPMKPLLALSEGQGVMSWSRGGLKMKRPQYSGRK